ncbi:hypothetical protein RND71_005511 [Anisodus tanguticus]|uniref:Uncharacterized protein n=1 Tax=Anisodus tanguticus TaxID=243964 RepID=A0AAE1SQ67_9SOLA|nr:hypothetical protein RND71_005511 [Anisodus tanguticus]
MENVEKLPIRKNVIRTMGPNEAITSAIKSLALQHALDAIRSAGTKGFRIRKVKSFDKSV